MNSIFDHPNHAECASDRISSIRQGARSIVRYAVEFSTPSRGGTSQLSRAYSTEGGMKRCLTHSSWGHGPLILINWLIAPLMLIIISGSNTERSTRLFPLHSQAPGEEPMQLGRALLSSSKRHRRYSLGSCLYCGQAGRFVHCSQKTELASTSRSSGGRSPSVMGRPPGHAAVGAQLYPSWSTRAQMILLLTSW